MFFDDAQQHPSESDTSESGIRFAMMLAELWHDWFEAMSEVADMEGHRTGNMDVSVFMNLSIFAPLAVRMKGQPARST